MQRRNKKLTDMDTQYDKLFMVLDRQHGVTPVQSEMDEIVAACRPFYAAEIARLEAAVNDLCSALRDLHDEQNDAPLERRRSQWEAAMENAIETLKLYEK